MDRVRFGRALGFGARQAVKTLVTAVDAATTENPSGKSADRGGSTGPEARTAERTASEAPAAQTLVAKAAHKAAQSVVQSREVRTALKRGKKRFGEAAWEPFARLSGVLWLEFAGVFFGIFALFAAGAVWKLRIWRFLKDRTAGFSVSPSTPQFQLSFSFVPSRLCSPLLKLCFLL